jgi:hypothetical protein
LAQATLTRALAAKACVANTIAIVNIMSENREKHVNAPRERNSVFAGRIITVSIGCMEEGCGQMVN